MDEQLIKTVNKLQDAFSTVGVHNPVDLPQIVVIGSQSSGKSSVLENIVGRDFLPRGSGIVTRRPLVLQLINRPRKEASKTEANGDASTNPADDTGEEWGEFLHLPGKKFYDFSEIRQEIVSDTEAKTGKNLGISPNPINLRIFSPNVLTLTLVDLPGLTKVPVGDQPKDIEKQIRDMLLKYISRPNAIILAVTAANTDLANSDGLKLAREVDPDGARTIGVLTKVDLMDKGTDVIDILAGRVIPLRLGYVPVVNRGQRDIETNKSIVVALEYERQFFENHPSYQSKSQYCGTPFLARKLNMILMHHIKTTLPEIKAKITVMRSKYENELHQLGEPVDSTGDVSNMLLSIIPEFCNDFRAVIEGKSNDMPAFELSGGARISFVFHEIFTNGIKAIDPLEEIKDVDIRTLLCNSAGSSPALFVATNAFETIVKKQIKRLESPCLRCVTLIYEELVRIVDRLLTKQVFKRFPDLKEEFGRVVIEFLKNALIPTNTLVEDMVSMEQCYINTAHPDFIGGQGAITRVNERLHPAKGSANDRSVQKEAEPPVDRITELDNEMNIHGKGSTSGSIFGSFISTKRSKNPMDAPFPTLKPTGTLSERERTEIEVIKLLIKSYFNIVKRTTIDMVPKAIMLKLVNHSKQDLQRELLKRLYNPESIKNVMKESDATVKRRKECKDMVKALEKADEIVSSV